MPWLPIFQKTYENVDGDEVHNGYVSNLTDLYTNELGHVIRRPGLPLYKDLGDDVAVANVWNWANQERVIALANGNIYVLNPTVSPVTAEKLGGDVLSNNRGSITESADGDKLIFASGGKMVYWNGTDDPYHIESPTHDSPPETVSSVITFDRCIIANRDGYGTIHWSDVNDPLTWQAANYASVDGASDNVLRLIKLGKEFGVIGNLSFEWYYNNATSFVTTGDMINIGTAAKYSVAQYGDSVFFIDQYRNFTRLSGRNYASIGFPKGKLIHDMTDISDAVCDIMFFQGRPFILVVFPSASISYMYDIALDRWADLTYFNESLSEHQRFLGQCAAYIENSHITLIGSRVADGYIYSFSPTTYTDNSGIIRSVLKTGHIDWDTEKTKESQYLRLYFKRGVAVATVTDPKVSIRWRDNHGSWGNWVERELGSFGERDPYVELRPMGQYRSRQYEIACTDAVQFIFQKAWEEVGIIES